MTNFIIGFWIGVFAHYGFMWLSTHPADRDALYSRIKAVFTKKDKDAP